jgi:hypothetical protein
MLHEEASKIVIQATDVLVKRFDIFNPRFRKSIPAHFSFPLLMENPGLARFQRVECDLERDAVKKALVMLPIRNPGQGPEDPEEYLLRGVLGILGMAENLKRDVVDDVLGCPKEGHQTVFGGAPSVGVE